MAGVPKAPRTLTIQGSPIRSTAPIGTGASQTKTWHRQESPVNPSGLRSGQRRLDNGVWTTASGERRLDIALDRWVIEEEFGVQYHPGHVRKLLPAFRCSGRAAFWHARMSPRRAAGGGVFIRISKKARTRDWALIFTDEAFLASDKLELEQPP